MGLQAYHEKRRFDQTPEPRGKPARSRGPLRFVVQKHQASRLHYDFRLELDGTLKSWAVPKGPSLDPADKRLAIMVEDHPLEYRTFEGIIPEGNYGAGTVMVWDSGTYHVPESTHRDETERLMRAGLERGRLRFVLEGKKLRGAYSLFKLKRGEPNAWLLVKSADAFATRDDVTRQDRSVVSRHGMERIAREAAGAGKVWRLHGKALELLLKDAPRSRFPHKIKPMLATLVDRPFDRPGWIFEPKWDGYRAIAEVAPKGVRLYSRNQKSYATKFAALVRSLETLPHEAVLDGEVVVLDAQGRSHFQLLQNYQKTRSGQLVYYVFDLLYLDGHDLRGLPLVRRKEILAQVIGATPDIKLSEHVEETGAAFYKAAAELELEGIIAKNGQSVYREGVRGPDWLKIKVHRRQEAVIGGFTEPRRSRQHLGALLLGVYEGDDLVYIGHTGGGFSDQDLAQVRKKLEPLERSSCPFRDRPKANAPVHWVEPRLVGEVKFHEWTASGTLRQPIFLGLRDDLSPRDVHREQPQPLGQTLKGSNASRPSRDGKPSRSRAKSRKAGSSGSDGLGDSNRVSLSNLEKVYWPDELYTKGDLVAYYRDVAPLILPYLRDRPESLNRHPNGITGKSFFQKDVSRQRPPAWVKTVGIPSQTDGRTIEYLLCQDEDTLLYLANLGCIELNPWNSRLGSLDKPDFLVIDLDPGDIGYAEVIAAARAVRRVLDKAGALSVCKTSGKTGLHIYVPLGARYDYEQAKQFAEIVANVVHHALPKTTSVVRNPAQRLDRVYLDFLQNRRGQTLAAPYAVRPVPGATISTPLAWREVRSGLDPAKFNLRTMRKRLDRLGDLWSPVLGPGINLEDCLTRMTKSARRSPP